MLAPAASGGDVSFGNAQMRSEEYETPGLLGGARDALNRWAETLATAA